MQSNGSNMPAKRHQIRADQAGREQVALADNIDMGQGGNVVESVVCFSLGKAVCGLGSCQIPLSFNQTQRIKVNGEREKSV